MPRLPAYGRNLKTNLKDQASKHKLQDLANQNEMISMIDLSQHPSHSGELSLTDSRQAMPVMKIDLNDPERKKIVMTASEHSP
jgi:hypothetical protein